LVDWAIDLISRLIKRGKDKLEAKQIVQNIYTQSQDKRLIVMSHYFPFTDTLLEFAEPLVVVYPNIQSNQWSAKVMPIGKNTFETRVLFPESWAGKSDQDLAEISGVSDAKFCH